MKKSEPAASILIVDDDPGVLRLAARTLDREGFQLTTAESGDEADKSLAKHQPDLLLLDLKLQDATASELISRFKKPSRLPPFVIITGQGDESVAVEMMKSGALDYLVKGKDFLESLPGTVRRALKSVETQKKLAAAERSLLLSEERFRVALKNSAIIVFNQDTDLRYTWVYNLPSGQNEATFIGKTDDEIFSTEEADRLTQIKARVLATGTGVRREVSWTANGNKNVYDLTVEPIVNPAGQIIGLTGSALDITARKRLEQEVLQISDLEQQRIGQDLHDGICQYLTGIELKSQALEQTLEKKSRALASEAEQIAKHVREAITQTRSLARSLSPFIVEAEGLVSGLKELATGAEKMFNIACDLEIESSVSIENPTVATHLYRIAQEAVSNAIKHGKANRVEIRLAAESGQTLLGISDNGRGFSDNPASTGMGLRIMQYRANAIGGTLLIQQKQHGGVNVACFFKSSGQ